MLNESFHFLFAQVHLRKSKVIKSKYQLPAYIYVQCGEKLPEVHVSSSITISAADGAFYPLLLRFISLHLFFEQREQGLGVFHIIAKNEWGVSMNEQ